MRSSQCIARRGQIMADVLLHPGAPVDHRAFFIEAAQLTDVLFDQLDHLVSHAEQDCPPGCSDCERLEQIKRLLLAPFESPSTPEGAQTDRGVLQEWARSGSPGDTPRCRGAR